MKVGSLSRFIAMAFSMLLLAFGNAHAGNVRLAWDPSFGSPFPFLGFAGTGVLRYPDACLASTGVIDNSDPCNTGPDAFSFASVVLDLYDLTADPTQSNPPAEELNFLGSTNLGTIENIIVGQNPSTLQNSVVGLNTFIFGPETTTGPVDGLPALSDVWLQFVTVTHTAPPGCEFNCFTVDAPQAFMFVRPPSGYDGPLESCPDGDGNSDCIRSAPALVTITTVPEPATIALLATALIAFMFVGVGRKRFGSASRSVS